MVDLNADLGESFGIWKLGDDLGLLSIVTSANIACGYHAGDASTMRRCCAEAARCGVRIGAQVGYRDLPGFGRRFIDMDPAQLTDEVIHQVVALDGIAKVEGGQVGYVKPHGALYNAIVDHDDQATAVVAAVCAANRALAASLPVYGLPGSAWLSRASEAGLSVVTEGFADRAYYPDGRLVPRREAGAVIEDVDLVVARSVAMATGRTIKAVDGSVIEIHPHSICVHGDTPGAVDMAKRIRRALTEAGVDVEAVD
jgi:5-oxoprolinase (ATP-hydrolysing) subunit A